MRVLLCIIVLILALVFQATQDVPQTQGVAIHYRPHRGTAGKGICASGRPRAFPSRAPPQPDRTPARLQECTRHETCLDCRPGPDQTGLLRQEGHVS